MFSLALPWVNLTFSLVTLVKYTELLMYKGDADKYQKHHLNHVITTYNYICTTDRLSSGSVVTFEIPVSPELIFFPLSFI
jgi:hypothetical protein